MLDLCNASQDLSEDEKISELLPISAQRIYVLSKLGKIASAEEVAAELSVDR
jgi:signal recognition particle subunit SRP72